MATHIVDSNHRGLKYEKNCAITSLWISKVKLNNLKRTIFHLSISLRTLFSATYHECNIYKWQSFRFLSTVDYKGTTEVVSHQYNFSLETVNWLVTIDWIDFVRNVQSVVQNRPIWWFQNVNIQKTLELWRNNI